MPISDEVIELAPVKKTKKTFIILFIALGVLLALAGTFLVLYLLKPSVTEQPVIVRSVEIKRDATESSLFAVNEGDGEVLYASIGHEYIVYADITVEQGASPNIQWEWPRDDIEIVESVDGEGAFIKFIPRAGVENGKEVTIKARSQSDVNKSDSITFKIVNQGAEDFKIVEYGFAGNTTKIDNDTLENTLQIEMPVYVPVTATNNKPYNVRYVQYGKYNATTNTYNKITAVGSGADRSDYVRVTAYNKGTQNPTDVVKITNKLGSFDIVAQKAGSVDLVIESNVNNGNPILTKKIELTVTSNINLKYPDAVYFFNKPVLDVDFIKSVAGDGASADHIAPSKLNALLNADATLSVSSSAQPDKGKAELVLPYSTSVKYENIYDHIVLNPLSVQYNSQANGGQGALYDGDKWKKNIKIESSNPKILHVTNDGKLETLKLCGTNATADKCNLVITDRTPGSVGTSITIPVRIVASNEAAILSVARGNGTPVKDTDGRVEIDAAPQAEFSATLEYNIYGPAFDKPELIAENLYINNAFELAYNPEQMDVRFKGGAEVLTPNKVHTFDSFSPQLDKDKVNITVKSFYKFTVEFTIKLKDVRDGQRPTLEFIKSGITLPGVDKTDMSWIKTVDFVVSSVATYANFVETKAGLREITRHGIEGETEQAGNYILSEDKKSVAVYVQNMSAGTLLDISSESGIRKLIESDASYRVGLQNEVLNTHCFEKYTSDNNTVHFKGAALDGNGAAARIVATVSNIDGKEISRLTVNVFVIDAVESFEPLDDAAPVLYDGNVASSNRDSKLTIRASYIGLKKINVFNKTPEQYYSSAQRINLYYGTDKIESNKLVRVDDPQNPNRFMFKRSKDDSDVLYYFDASENSLYPGCDIYALSVTDGRDFSHVCIEFLLESKDEYVGKHYNEKFENTATLVATFTRKADGVALFYDNDFKVDSPSRIQADTEGDFKGKLRHRVNQNLSQTIYISSVVSVNGTDVIARSDRGLIASCEGAYMQVPNSFTVDNPNDAIYGKARCYYDMKFTAPLVGTSGEEYRNITGFTVFYNAGNSSGDFVLTVENAARMITGIKLYSDEACTEENEIKTDLIFGDFINSRSQFAHTVYVKIDYEAAADRHTLFESALLTVPNFLTLTAGDDRITNEGSADGKNIYRLRSSQNKVKEQDFTSDKFACRFVLEDNAGAHDGSDTSISIEQALSSGIKVQASVAVRVSTGLKSISVVDPDGQQQLVVITQNDRGVAEKTFFLSGRGDLQTLTFNLDYDPLADGKYGIDFNYKHQDRFVVGYPTGAGGFEVGTTVKNDLSQITIKVTSDVAVSADYYTFTFTFTDKANGTSENNTFVLDVKVRVQFDIYEIGFGQDSGSANAVYNIVTSGDNAESQTPVTLTFNENDPKYAPRSTSGVRMYIATKTAGGEYAEYVAGTNGVEYELRATSDGYLLVVKNTVKNDSAHYVVAEYTTAGGNKITQARNIVVTTSDCMLDFADGNTVTVNGAGEAAVNIENGARTFKLAAVLTNVGGANVSDIIIDYALYSDEACNTITDEATVDRSGNIAFTPKHATGRVYYKASVTGDGVTGVQPLIVKIDYTVAAKGVELDAVPDVLGGETLTLYFVDGNNYTYVDLSGCILPQSDFAGVSINKADAKFSITSTSGKLHINGLEIIPLGLTSTAETVTVKAEYGGQTASRDYKVIVKAFDPLTLSATSDTIDIINKNTIVVNKNNYTVPAGFTSAYALTGPAGVSIASDNKTVAIGTLGLGDYTLTGTVTYTVATGSAQKPHGAFVLTDEFGLKVDCVYEPDFEMKKGGAAVNNYDDKSTKHLLDAADLSGYALNVLNTSHGDSKAVYSFDFSQANNIVSASGATTGENVNLNVSNRHSGEFTLTLTVSIYGREFTKSHSYYFAYGQDPVTALSYATKGTSTSTVVNSGNTLYIDYSSASDMKVVKYTVSRIDSTSEVKLTVSGGVANGDTVIEGNNAYITVNATGNTVLYFGGTVTTGSYTVYLRQSTLTLDSHAPEFAFDNFAKTLNPLEETTLSAVNTVNDFVGGFTPKYSIISGDEFASLDESSGAFTVNSSVTTTQKVRVKAEITVNTGVYSGKKYEIYEEITITGVPLPTLAWKNAPASATAGQNISLAGLYGLASGTDNRYDGKVDFTVIASRGVVNDDLTSFIVPAELTAGGKITLTLGGTVKNVNIANKGETLVSVTHEITVTPSAVVNNTPISVPNAKGSIDFNLPEYLTSFAPISGTGDDQIDPDDTYKIVSLALAGTYDAQKFGVSGSNLVIKNNVVSATELTLKAKIVMNDGAYVGTLIDVTVKVNIAAMPNLTAKADWNGTGYNTISLNNLGVSGAVDVVPASGFTVNNNGGTSPTLTIDKAYNLYLYGSTDEHVAKDAVAECYVTTQDGKVYYRTLTVSVPAQAVTVSVKVDGTLSDVASGETLAKNGNIEREVNSKTVLNVFAGAFDISIENISIPENSGITHTSGERSVMLNAASVTEAPVAISLTLRVRGIEQTIDYPFTVSVSAPQTGEGYSVDKTEFNLAVGSDGTCASSWTYISGYRYGYTLELSSTSNLSNISVSGATSNRNNKKFTFNEDHYNEVRSFTLSFKVDTATARVFTFTATYTVYGSSSYWSTQYQTITKTYTVRVIDKIAVTLNNNAGSDSVTGGTASVDITYAGEYTVYAGLPDTLTRKGYVFDGWYRQPVDIEGGRIYNGTRMDASVYSAHMLYAHWSLATYPISYFYGFSDAPTTEIPGVSGAEYKYGNKFGALAGMTYDRKGYTFAGWYTEINGGGIHVTAETVVDEPANKISIELYAYWTKNIYTVKFAGGDHITGTVNDMRVVFEDRLVLPTPDVEAGYEFIGWYLDSGFATPVPNALNETMIGKANADKEITLYAKIGKKSYTLTFNLGGGSWAEGYNAPTIALKADDRYGSLPTAANVYRQGYTFDGWYTANDTLVTDTTVYAVANGTTLYAKWSSATYKVTLNLDGGNLGDKNTYEVNGLIYGSTFDMHTMLTPARDGYTFGGWFITEGDAERDVTNAAVTVNGNVTITAKWTAVVPPETNPDQSGSETEGGTDGETTGGTTSGETTEGGEQNP